jgi:magnesium transporter
VIVNYAVYGGGKRLKQGRASIEEAAAAGAGHDFVWLELADPSEAELRAASERFGLHELAVEDAHHAHQRPKIEQYEDSLFVVLRTARYDSARSEISLGEIHLFIGRDYVIVVRHGGDPADLDQIRARAELHPELMNLGPGAVLYAVMDEVVDDYAPVVEQLSEQIADVETDVFSESVRDATERIYMLKREVLRLHRATSPLVLPVERLHRGEYPQIHSEMEKYFRDVYDHIERIDDQIESFRELLTGVLEANVSLVSVRQNEIVQKISGWAAIIAVPTLITGVYGMNFQHMPELRWPAGYPLALLAMLAVAGTLYLVLRRIRWL